MITPDVSNAPAGRAVEPAEGVAKRVGIREIAKRANVSVATVSMVLNQNPKITEATARKVRLVIDAAGYQPNRIAQSLSGKYTRVLAVLLPTLRHALADPYFGEIISGIIDKADRFGHKVMIDSAKPEFIRTGEHLELFSRRFVDGILCIGFGGRHSFLKDFVENDHPAILVNNVLTDVRMDHVVCDYASGAEQVMTYLFQLGHQHIGLIHGTPAVHTADLIKQCYERRLAARNRAVRTSMMVDGRFTEEGGMIAADAILDAEPDTTALFCGNDKMALGAIRAITRRGMSVPGDVSVVGFDDIAYGQFINPPLTTVHLPLHEAGAVACERLINRIRGKHGPVREMLPTHLVLRESTSIARTVTG